MTLLRIPLTVGAIALLVAVAPWPDAYYVGLRFLVSGICIFAAYVSVHERSTLLIPFLVAGVLFNPIVPAQMTRAVWIAADLVVATGFIAVIRWAPRPAAETLMEIQPADGTASQALESP